MYKYLIESVGHGTRSFSSYAEYAEFKKELPYYKYHSGKLLIPSWRALILYNLAIEREVDKQRGFKHVDNEEDLNDQLGNGRTTLVAHVEDFSSEEREFFRWNISRGRENGILLLCQRNLSWSVFLRGDIK